MEPLGPKIRRQRRRLGLTLDELGDRTSISKPYLSLIETGRVPNPPSDEKLRRLEQTLGFTPGELLAQAHLQRTPRDVRAMLQKLMKGSAGSPPTEPTSHPRVPPQHSALSTQHSCGTKVDLDEAYLSGMLQVMVENSAANIKQVGTNAVPVINRVSAGYPQDFTDLAYPPRVADEYLSCPDVRDRDAFATRVDGDSMTPKYSAGDIVIFSPALPPRDGDDCFVRFADGRTTFKRAFFEKNEGGGAVIRLQPRNERYRAQTIPAEEIAGLYRAVYRYQRVDDGKDVSSPSS